MSWQAFSTFFRLAWHTDCNIELMVSVSALTKLAHLFYAVFSLSQGSPNDTFHVFHSPNPTPSHNTCILPDICKQGLRSSRSIPICCSKIPFLDSGLDNLTPCTTALLPSLSPNIGTPCHCQGSSCSRFYLFLSFCIDKVIDSAEYFTVPEWSLCHFEVNTFRLPLSLPFTEKMSKPHL